MRRPPPRSALALLAVTALGAGCATAPAPAAAPGQIQHVVLVWLQRPGDAEVERQLEATGRSFVGQIPGLLAVEVGDAGTAATPTHDNTFDLAFVMRFADAAALAAYEEHPVHQRAVLEVLRPAAARLLVHDVVLR